MSRSIAVLLFSLTTAATVLLVFTAMTSNVLEIEDQAFGPVVRLKKLTLIKGGFVVFHPFTDRFVFLTVVNYIPPGKYADISIPLSIPRETNSEELLTRYRGAYITAELLENTNFTGLSETHLVPGYRVQETKPVVDVFGHKVAAAFRLY